MRPSLRRFAGALAGVVALSGACTSGGPGEVTPSTPPSGSGQPAVSPEVAFQTGGGDVFGWTQSVRIKTKTDCPAVDVTVNGDATGVRVKGAGRSFAATVPIAFGQNELLAVCTGTDGSTLESAPVMFTGRLDPRPTSRIALRIEGATITLDGSSSKPTKPDGSPVAAYAWSPDAGNPAGNENPAPLKLASGMAFAGPQQGARLQLATPAKDGEYYVKLTVTDEAGRTDDSSTYFVVQGGVARAVNMATEHPAWIDRAVIYAPIPDLTEEGGPLGVEKQLPYLKKLGVNTLWLWPPTQLRASGEEYAITNYFDLDSQWGSEAEFKHMVDTAHRLGFHVLIDFVPNHTSDQSPMFVDAETYGKASPYYDFYDRKPNGRPTHYFDWTNLPNLNYENSRVRTMIIEASIHWVRDLGIDGFRTDAAWGVKRRRPDFWPEWRAAIKRVKPDVLLLAEASAVDPYYFSHGFDVGYDWTDQPGQWAWTSVFDFLQEIGPLLEPAVTNGGKGYAEDAIVMRFINNNDTDIRFVDQYDAATTKVAATLMFMLPGVPEMFAGDEIGASYVPYSTLTPIEWTDRFGLRPTYKKLIQLKRTLPTLASNQVESILPSSSSAYAFVRPAFGGGPPVLVILNFGDRGKITLPMTDGVRSVVGSGRVTDLLTGRDQSVAVTDAGLSITMKASTGFVFVPAGA